MSKTETVVKNEQIEVRAILSPSLNPSDSAELVADRQGEGGREGQGEVK